MSEESQAGEKPSGDQMNECVDCRKPKAQKICQLCEEPVCKSCVQTLDLDAFSFYPVVPDELKHTFYCGGCFDSTVAPAQDEYQEIMERAKQAFVFFTTQKRQPPLLSKAKEAYRVQKCDDRDETILRLAFLAAKEGYNAIVQVEVNSEKVRNEAYQTSRWSGRGFGASVDAARMERFE